MTLVLTEKAKKLMRLCEIAGYNSLSDLLASKRFDRVCPAICMTEGCDHVEEIEKDQGGGYCSACGGRTMVSVVIVAGLS